MKIREQDQRCVRRYAEYPSSYAWPTYQYRCPECRRWHSGSEVTMVHDDGTESYLCPECADRVTSNPTIRWESKQEDPQQECRHVPRLSR